MIRKDVLAKLAALGFAIAVTPGAVNAAITPSSNPGTSIEMPSPRTNMSPSDFFIKMDIVEQLALRSIGVDIT